MHVHDPVAPRPRAWMRQSQLDGLAALVAGGGSGIGEETARIIAANGGKVVVADIRGEAADRVAAAIVADGGAAIAVAMDVAEQTDIDAAVAAGVAAWGRLGDWGGRPNWPMQLSSSPRRWRRSSLART